LTKVKDADAACELLSHNFVRRTTMGPMRELNRIFERWRVAEEAARAAENALFDVALQSFAGMRAPPDPAQAEGVRTLRAQANEMFDETIAKLRECANDKATGMRCSDRRCTGS